MSMRNSTNKNFGQHIGLVDQTLEDGTFPEFKLRYYDIRFSNLCNFTCRTCGGWFSSSWYTEEEELYGKRNYPKIMFAGRTEIDMWEQLEPHIPYLEQVYFAGGEPMMMEEHYRILKELVKREMFDVKLIYNTNFSRLTLKDDNVLNYWKLFNNVSIGASLDAMGPRAEYIRKGTDWPVVEENRRLMLDMCPQVDFYVSATMSIFNALHLPDFHQDWVDRGLIRAQDFHVNILQNPAHYRIDIATTELKEQIIKKFDQHLAWLRPQDYLKRATQGFESATTFLNSTDNSHLIPVFWEKTNQLDAIRNENILDIIPELAVLK